MDLSSMCSIGSFFIEHIVSPIAKISKKLKSFWIYLLNKQVMWSITARFKSGNNTDFADCVLENIKKYFVDEYRKTLDSKVCTIDKDIPKKTFVYSCSGLTFQVDYSGDIFIQLREYHAPYRDSRKLIDEKILPLLRHLEELIGRDASNSKLIIGYTCKIKFEGENPFMGQYLLKDADLDLKTFTCVLEGKTEKSKIKIHKNTFEFHSDNLSLLQSLMAKHLSVGG